MIQIDGHLEKNKLASSTNSCLVSKFFLLCVVTYVPHAFSDAYAGSPMWTLRSSIGPTARDAHAMAFDSARGQVLLFGGRPLSNDTWIWAGGSWTQASPTVSPSARLFHMMTYDSTRDRIVLFGGQGGGALNDTWEWNGLSSSWTQITTTHSPSPRLNGAMAFDSIRGRTVLFGGYNNASTLFNETWEYDGSDWIQKNPITAPSARQGCRMAFDSTQGKVVLFGGNSMVGSFVTLSDTWEWDGTSWVLVPGSSPSARSEHAMAFDAKRGGTVLFGGLDASFTRLSDTWEYDATGWSQIAVVGAPKRHEHAMVYDSSCSRIVMFGGSDSFNGGSPQYADTWDYTTTPQDTDGDGWLDTCDQCPFDPTNTKTPEGQCIPTLSQWGVGVMVLLLLTAGTVVAMKRAVRVSR